MPDNADDNKPLNRRSFFRDGLFEMLKPLAGPIGRKIAPIERLAEEFRKLEEGDAPKSAPPQAAAHYGPTTYSLPQYVLRPPGALDEDKFLETCTRCGHCV